MRHSFSIFAVLIGVFAAAPLHAAPSEQPSEQPSQAPPNIVLIISDDHGFPDYGFMGHPDIKTPHLDRLAAESHVYTRGYVSTPLCCPSLTTMQTGLYAYQHGYTGNDPAEGGDRQPWLDRYKTTPQLPLMLQEKGYLSLHTGKFWQKDPAIAGFTHTMGATGRHGSSESLGIGRNGMQPVYDFIDEAQDKQKPFLVWYAPFLPHTPHNPPERLLSKYQHLGHSAKYYAMVEWLDETCGELLGYLKSKGLEENTVVMFVSDNGWPGKDKVYPSELGMRTPITIKWPGKVEPKMDVSNMASNIDLAPTILSIAGLETHPMMPGIDLLDFDVVEKRKYVFGDNYHHDMVQADRPEASLRARVLVSKQWKLIVWQEKQPDLRKIPWQTKPPADQVELFNLQLDPFEQTNLAAARPDLVKALRAELDAWWTPRE